MTPMLDALRRRLRAVALRSPSALFWRRSLPIAVIVALCCLWLSTCSLPLLSTQTVTLATLFPTSGAEGALGDAMTRAVDLAVQQNASPGAGYALTVTHIAPAGQTNAAIAAATARAVANSQVVGVVGPLESQAALASLPALAQAGVATISPTATLPGLTQPDQAAAEGLSFSRLRPPGKPTTFFRLTADDNAIGASAAAFALSSPLMARLGTRSAFLVDDGSLSGRAQTSAFRRAFSAGGGAIAGAASVTQSGALPMQALVTAIIRAAPGGVFYAGAPALAGRLRHTLSLTGAPQLPLLVTSFAADDPAWSAAVGGGALADDTLGLASTQDLARMPGAAGFISAYHRAYPGAAITPESALAYDAAMVEIDAIRSLIAGQQPITRATLLGAIAQASYTGVTGHIAFDRNGDRVAPPAFALYTCALTGVWRYQTSLAAAGS